MRKSTKKWLPNFGLVKEIMDMSHIFLAVNNKTKKIEPLHVFSLSHEI